MYIAGLDLSYTSPGIVVEKLNDNFEIIELNRYGFSTVKKYSNDNDIIYYNDDNFKHIYFRYDFFNNYILNWTKDCEYISVEDYAISKSGEQGRIFNLAEFEGFIKQSLFKNGKKLRFYTPNQNKKIFSGYGNADKIGMRDALINKNLANAYGNIHLKLDDIPPVLNGKQGAKPTSDIIDAFSLCESLRIELKLRNNIISINDVEPYIAEVFTNNGTKKTKTGIKKNPSILESEFLYLN